VRTLVKTTTSIDAEDVEDCFAGGDTLQISTTSLHRRKIISLDQRLVKIA